MTEQQPTLLLQKYEKSGDPVSIDIPMLYGSMPPRHHAQINNPHLPEFLILK